MGNFHTENLGKILGGDALFKDLEYQRKMLRCLSENWTQIVGKLAPQIRLEFIRGKVLVIATENPLWMSEIRYYKADILTKINTLLTPLTGQKQTLTDLRVMIEPPSPTLPTQSPPRPTPKTLQEAIQWENQDRKNRGERLCSRCHTVYTASSICVFCRSGVK